MIYNNIVNDVFFVLRIARSMPVQGGRISVSPVFPVFSAAGMEVTGREMKRQGGKREETGREAGRDRGEGLRKENISR